MSSSFDVKPEDLFRLMGGDTSVRLPEIPTFQPKCVYTVIERLRRKEGSQRIIMSAVGTYSSLATANQAATNYAIHNVYSKAKEVDKSANLETSFANGANKYVITSGPFRYGISILKSVQDPGLHHTDRQPLRFPD